MSSLVCTSASALVLKRDSSEAASRLRSRQLAGRSLHPASRQAGRPGTLPRAPSRSAPRGPHLRARPFAPAHDAAPMRSLCGCGDYRRPAAEPRMGIPPAPLARRLPRQSATRKRADTCRETRGLVRSVSRYVTSSPLHSGRPRELPASSRTSFPVRVVKICFLHYCFGLRLFVFFGLLHDFRPPRQLLRLQFAIFPAKLALFSHELPVQ